MIAAICHGPWLLINAGVAKGKHLTSRSSIKMDLMNAGAIWVDQSVVKDGSLITSRKPEDIPEFYKALVEYLNAYKKNPNNRRDFSLLLFYCRESACSRTHK